MAVHVGEIGKEIILNTTADISGATQLRIYYWKPDKGEQGYFTATQKTTTSIAYVTTDEDDLDKRGQWTLQAWKADSGTPDGFVGEKVFMTVESSIKARISGLER